MLRSFFRFVSGERSTPSRLPETVESTGAECSNSHPVQLAPQATGSTFAAKAVDHRAHVMSMRLEHTRICGARRCETLRHANIVTAGDLASCDPKKVAQGLGFSSQATARLRKYRRAIRLSASVQNLMPREAHLLICVHRTTVSALAIENASVLHRDLERFAMSSVGRRILKGRRVPSIRKVRSWIQACREQTGEVRSNAVAIANAA